MAVFGNKKRPWLDDNQEMQSRLWVDEKQNEIAKILPKEKFIDRIPINNHLPYIPALFGLLFFGIGGGKPSPFPFPVVLQYWLFIFILTVVVYLIDAFIYHKSKGYIEIYSGMMAVYKYDEELKRLYLSGHYDWADITHYDSGIDGIRIDLISGQYICFKAKRKEFYPYLLQYAPQAKKLTYEERKRRAKVRQREDKMQEVQWKKENAEYRRLMKERKKREKEAKTKAKKQEDNKDKK